MADNMATRVKVEHLHASSASAVEMDHRLSKPRLGKTSTPEFST